MQYFFFFNDTATTEIYTLSLHDALPIYIGAIYGEKLGDHDRAIQYYESALTVDRECLPAKDRKSTRLNSSHSQISYAVFCLKKKNNHKLNIDAESGHLSLVLSLP